MLGQVVGGEAAGSMEAMRAARLAHLGGLAAASQLLAARVAHVEKGGLVSPDSSADSVGTGSPDRASSPPRQSRTDETDSDLLIAMMLQEEFAFGSSAAAVAATRGNEVQSETGAGYRSSHDVPRTVDVAVVRDGHGSAGYAFDRANMKITSIKANRTDLVSMKVGDAIVAVNGAPARNFADYSALAQGAQRFLLTLERGQDADASRQLAARPRRRSSSAVGHAAPPPPSAPPGSDRPRRRAAQPSTARVAANVGTAEAASGSGMSDSAMKRLFPVERLCGGGSDCAICLESFCDGDEVVRLRCEHAFHPSCIHAWLRRQARCPYCNGNVRC